MFIWWANEIGSSSQNQLVNQVVCLWLPLSPWVSHNAYLISPCGTSSNSHIILFVSLKRLPTVDKQRKDMNWFYNYNVSEFPAASQRISICGPSKAFPRRGANAQCGRGSTWTSSPWCNQTPWIHICCSETLLQLPAPARATQGHPGTQSHPCWTCNSSSGQRNMHESKMKKIT